MDLGFFHGNLGSDFLLLTNFQACLFVPVFGFVVPLWLFDTPLPPKLVPLSRFVEQNCEQHAAS
jgi:hypothetical protein